MKLRFYQSVLNSSALLHIKHMDLLLTYTKNIFWSTCFEIFGHCHRFFVSYSPYLKLNFKCSLMQKIIACAKIKNTKLIIRASFTAC